MLQIATAENLEEATRQLAAEFLVVLCEAREKAPGMMRKLPTFSQSIFQIMLTFLLDIEVCPTPTYYPNPYPRSEGCVTLDISPLSSATVVLCTASQRHSCAAQ